MQTCRSNTRRAARSLLAENEVTHTRSQAPVRRSTAASGSTAGASFRSILNRTSGQAPSRSSSNGIGSVPSISAAATSRWFILAIRPGLAGHPGQGPVVEGDEHPVQRRLDVGLQVPIAQPDGVLEGLPRVLRGVRRPPAVRKRNRPGVVEECGRHAPSMRHQAEQAVNGS